jgi:hypothetical protein
MQLIQNTVEAFNETMSEQFKKLEEVNGGKRIESDADDHPFC